MACGKHLLDVVTEFVEDACVVVGFGELGSGVAGHLIGLEEVCHVAGFEVT